MFLFNSESAGNSTSLHLSFTNFRPKKMCLCIFVQLSRESPMLLDLDGPGVSGQQRTLSNEASSSCELLFVDAKQQHAEMKKS